MVICVSSGTTHCFRCTALQSSAQPPRDSGVEGLSASSWWEVTIVASITVLALALRVSNLRDVPFNIYPDEVMTGLVSERAYLSGPSPAPPSSARCGVTSNCQHYGLRL